MKSLLFAFCVLFVCYGLSAQQPAWQPSPGHTQVPIWPGAVPDARPVTGPETIKPDAKDLAGRPWIYINNVSRPTMTVYSPKERIRALRSSYFLAEAIRFRLSILKARRSVIG
jgi:hypothetical protein